VQIPISQKTLPEEQKLTTIVRFSTWVQCVWFLLAITVLYFKPPHYQNIANSFAVTALIASFIASKIYIRTGKIVENLKTFTKKERSKKLKEYFLYFFLPYPIWVGLMIASSYF